MALPESSRVTIVDNGHISGPELTEILENLRNEFPRSFFTSEGAESLADSVELLAVSLVESARMIHQLKNEDIGNCPPEKRDELYRRLVDKLLGIPIFPVFIEGITGAGKSYALDIIKKFLNQLSTEIEAQYQVNIFTTAFVQDDLEQKALAEGRIHVVDTIQEMESDPTGSAVVLDQPYPDSALRIVSQLTEECLAAFMNDDALTRLTQIRTWRQQLAPSEHAMAQDKLLVPPPPTEVTDWTEIPVSPELSLTVILVEKQGALAFWKHTQLIKNRDFNPMLWRKVEQHTDTFDTPFLKMIPMKAFMVGIISSYLSRELQAIRRDLIRRVLKSTEEKIAIINRSDLTQSEKISRRKSVLATELRKANRLNDRLGFPSHPNDSEWKIAAEGGSTDQLKASNKASQEIIHELLQLKSNSETAKLVDDLRHFIEEGVECTQSQQQNDQSLRLFVLRLCNDDAYTLHTVYAAHEILSRIEQYHQIFQVSRFEVLYTHLMRLAETSVHENIFGLDAVVIALHGAVERQTNQIAIVENRRTLIPEDDLQSLRRIRRTLHLLGVSGSSLLRE